MNSAVAMISPKFYGFDPETGNPLASGKVYTYAAGTNTPKATYASEDAEVANPNPVILNAAGYANIYLRGSYKIVVKDADDVEVWTADPVSDAASLLKPWIQETAATQVAPDQFKVTGNLTDVFRYGRAVKLDDTVIFYGTVLSSSYLSGETFVTIDAVDNLTSDLSRVFASLVDLEAMLPVLDGDAGQTLVDAVTASLATFEPRMEQRFADFLVSSGYQFLGNYQAGIEVTEYNQVIRDPSGEFWRAAGATVLPYTTTGAGFPEGGAFVNVGDAVLRQDLAGTLADGEGAFNVTGATIYTDTLAELNALPTVGLADGQRGQTREGDYYWSLADTAWKKVPVVDAQLREDLLTSIRPLLSNAQLGMGKLEVLAGSIRQNASDRTKWDFIKDASHEPIGLDDSVSATASGSTITVNYSKAYNRVVSLIAVPDEFLANAIGLTTGTSVGTSLAQIKASANRALAANIYWTGSAWDIAYGTGQGNTGYWPTISSAVWDGSSTLTLTHDEITGVDVSVSTWSRDGAIITGMLTPVIKLMTPTTTEIQFLNSSGALVAGSSSPTTNMSLTFTKRYSGGVVLDGTDGYALDGGNIWLLGVMELAGEGTISVAFLLEEEGDDVAAWSSFESEPIGSSVSGQIVLPSGASRYAMQTGYPTPGTDDYEITFGLRMENATGYSYLQFNAGGTGALHFALGYDWTVGSQSTGTISSSVLATGEDLQLDTGIDYSTLMDFKIVVSSSGNTVEFYIKEAGVYVLKATGTYESTLALLDGVVYAHGGTGPYLEAGLDYLRIQSL